MVKRFVAALALFLALSPLLALEREPLAEYKSRREKLMQRFTGNVIVLRATDDTEFVEYKPEENFFYLTGFDQPNAVLLLDASSTPQQEYFFLPERKHDEERWTGEKLGPGPDAAKTIGIAKVLPTAEFDETLRRVSPNAKGVLDLAGVKEAIGNMRQVKSATEVGLIEKAIQITIKAHESAAHAIRAGAMEYEVEAALEYEFRRHGAERPGFPSIVGSGPFSTVLHYDKNTRRMEAGEVVVVDIGAEYSGYSADITRTYPVSGKFSKRQQEIYQIVLDAQKAAFTRIKPGVTLAEIHQTAMSHIRGKGYADYFIHGTSHHIGLNVHDGGSTRRPLEPGMVITVEPGVYLPEEKLGVRIEDDVLVTDSGYRILSNLPKEISQVENMMRR